MRLISLGRACEVGYQIKLHTQKTDGDFFDWLITPFDSLITALDRNLENLLNPGDLYLQEDKNFVNNRITGIQYGHVFLRDEAHLIPENFLEDLPRVQQKFEHFRAKFLASGQGGEPICFMRRDVNAEQAMVLDQRLIGLFPSVNFQIGCVNSADLGIAALANDRLLDLRIPDGGHDGLGYPDPWADALVAAGLTNQPFQKTKGDVVIPWH